MNIAFFTSARSEFWALSKVLDKFIDEKVNISLIVSGTHLSGTYDYSIDTIKKLYEKKLKIYEVPYLLDGDYNYHYINSVGLGIINMSSIINQISPSCVVLGGDRYDILIPAVNCLFYKIPIIHIGGGQVTSGSIDDNIRNAITKLAHIHIATTEKAAENISKMGEEDWRISYTGSPTVDKIYESKYPIKEIYDKFKIDLNKKTILCTFHPATNDVVEIENQIDLFMSMTKRIIKNYQIIFTAPGADEGSSLFLKKIKQFCSKNNNAFLFYDLGTKMYLSIMSKVSFVLGNSSSGIIEAPSMKVPTINVGNRQKNRIRSKSVFDIDYDGDIESLINRVNSLKDSIEYDTPYDSYKDGKNYDRIYKVIKNSLKRENLLNKKLDFEVKKNEWNQFF